ncbi:helix-turn-helix domain-containing protein [Actinomadura sp. 9N215]|uniref:helix-turn-helix domain-containing protein n=1 Tax=Actinomadura sp. 9N215 TaxID=3375150 RepID=UPI00378FFCD6
MSTPARQARDALGTRLRDIRKDAGLTGLGLAGRAGWHSSKVSKIEHGKQNPTEDEIRTWYRLCGVDDQVGDLVATMRSIETMYVELRRLHRAGTAEQQRKIIEEERQTKRLRGFQMFLVPGLLQTAEYAHARLTEGIDLLGLRDDVEAAVQARMERQQLLYRGDHRIHIVVCEVALTAGMADTGIMLGQLDRLLAVSSLPRLHLGIILTRAAHGYAPMCSFWIHDERMVTVETISAELNPTQPREVGLYLRAFARFAAAAVYGAGARTLIEAARRTLAS